MEIFESYQGRWLTGKGTAELIFEDAAVTSNHLLRLHRQGLLRRRKKGREYRYTLSGNGAKWLAYKRESSY